MEQVSPVAVNSALIICELAIVEINNNVVIDNSFFIYPYLMNKVKNLIGFSSFK
jgi:hypothetical protein